MTAVLDGKPMAKKKAKTPDWIDKPKKPVVVQLRGSDAFKAWVDGLCKADRRSISDLTEVALVKYAQSIGYKPDPPER